MDPGNWDIISGNFLLSFFASLLRKLLIPNNKKAELNLSLSVWLELGRLDSLTWDIWQHRYIIRNYSFPQFLCNLKTIIVSTFKSVDLILTKKIPLISQYFGWHWIQRMCWEWLKIWNSSCGGQITNPKKHVKAQKWEPMEKCEMKIRFKIWECIENCEIKICHIPHCSACSSSETLAVEAMKLVWNFRYDENALGIVRWKYGFKF